MRRTPRTAGLEDAIHQLGLLMAALLEGGEPPIAAGETRMTDQGQITAPRSAPLSARLEEAINHLSLGIVVFDEKREVVFCNERYREMYGLSPEQVKPGTPTSELIRHRLKLGLKVRSRPTITSASASAATSRSTPRSGIHRRPDHRLHRPPDAGRRRDGDPRGHHRARRTPCPAEEAIRTRQGAGRGVARQNFQFDTAINNMSQGLCFFDSDHRLIVCNDRFVEIYIFRRARSSRHEAD